MAVSRQIDWVFFDIGRTLGERNSATGKLDVYTSTRKLMVAMHELGPRLGVITTLGSQLTIDQGKQLLKDANLWQLIDPSGFISDHEAGAAKPDLRIYQFAAQQVGAAIDHCMYVGEDLVEVLAAEVAGMRACLKPSPPGRELAAWEQ